MATALAPRCLRTPSPWAGWPLFRAMTRRSSRPSSTVATSASVVTVPSRSATTSARNSSTPRASPRSRTFSSRSRPSNRPAGSSTCWRSSARTTSAAVTLRASIRTASSHTRRLRSRYPPSRISPTPGTVCSRSRTRRASSASSCGGRSPVTATQRIGWSSGLLFVITGGSRARGRRRWACATRVCVSCSAASMSRPTSNSSVTVARPCCDEDEMSTIPSTLMHASSTSSTTSVSMVSGDAPSRVSDTVTCGKSTSGIWLTPSSRNPRAPKTIRPAISIHAKTGLRTAASESLIGRPSRRPPRPVRPWPCPPPGP